MQNNISYRKLDDSDVSNLEELFEVCFKSKPKEDFLKWKYFSKLKSEVIIYGAFLGNKLIGAGALLPEILQIGGDEKLVYKFTDLMTHTEFQKKGISKKINKLLTDFAFSNDVFMLYTLCSKVSTKSFLRSKWIKKEDVLYFFKPTMLILNKSLKKYNITTEKDYKLFEMNNSKKMNNSITLIKTLDYLNWRYHNPNYQYFQLTLENGRSKKSSLIYSISNNFLNIIDYDFDKKKDLKILLSKAEQISKSNKLKGVLIFGLKSNNSLFFILKGYFYNPLKFGPLKSILDLNFICNEYSDNKIVHSSDWNLKAINYDDI